MSTQFSVEQVAALAPDESSLKSGRELAQPGKWVTLGRDERCAWGEIRGSGKDPYQTRIDLSEPAFKCSCPSRKFPCKHAIGLFLILVEHPAKVISGEPPEWVATWLGDRASRAEKKAAKEQARASGEDAGAAAVRDEAAAAKRAAQREAKVAGGMSELGQWLRDLVRQGLAALHHQPDVWPHMAARLVDAQAPGAARLVRECAELAASGQGWESRLLRRLGMLHLLVDAWQRIEVLPAGTQADVRSVIGLTQSQGEVLSQTGVVGEWLILGQRVEQEEQLRVQRTWLWGGGGGSGEPTGPEAPARGLPEAARLPPNPSLALRAPLSSSIAPVAPRSALVLSFAAPGQPLDASLVPGCRFSGELVFFPGGAPLRALVRHRGETVGIAGWSGYDTIAAAIEADAAALAANPWHRISGFSLRQVHIVCQGADWSVCDVDGSVLPISPRFGTGWTLLALGGGQPIDLFGEWDGESLMPLSARAEGRFHTLTARRLLDAG